MAQHHSSRSSKVRTNGRRRWDRSPCPPSANEITDIIPFDEFGSLDDLDFPESTPFDSEARVLHAPELDDLCDADDLAPLQLAAPAKIRPQPPAARHARQSGDVDPAFPRRGQHRTPSTANTTKGRLLIAAMATGAAAAGAHAIVNNADTMSTPAVLASGQSAIGGAAIETFSGGAELVTLTPPADAATHQEELTNGVAFAAARADREKRLSGPLYVMPVRGIPTSGYGMRWGAMHGGIDIANAIGTPVLAVTDAVVISAGPYGGYGNCVRLRHPDGTVTLYGHLNTIIVSVGERVMAGDQIATLGNTGNSTGPHTHFEVHLNGTNRVDPVPWLAARGINIGGFAG